MEQHYRTKHSTARFDDSVIKQAGTLTRQEVAKKTLENIKAMNAIRSTKDTDMNVYKKYEVWKEEDEVTGLPMDPSTAQVVTINGKGEKEVAKRMCLYLWHRGEIFQIQESNRGANVVVRDDVKTVKFRCWKTKEGFYLETYFCKLVGILYMQLSLLKTMEKECNQCNTLTCMSCHASNLISNAQNQLL